jgi:hypothetical protein
MRKLLHFEAMSPPFDETWKEAFPGSPYWLRFELGGEKFGCLDAPVPRFVQALTRSSRLLKKCRGGR